MALAQRNPAIQQAYSQLKVISTDQRNRTLYENRLKAQRDQWSREHAARLEGEARGEARALRSLIKNMRDSGFSIDQIEKATKIPKTNIKAILEGD
ncbi:hypothetical protein AGMMS49938_18340 [Fibrobacterales bacterium]|nr:hypothetical protein AGMMS49938_18340 [Fibrobacterales bacterium]